MSAKKFLIPALGAAVLAGGAIAFFAMKKVGPADSGAVAIAKAIPDEAYFASYVSLDEKAWAQLDKFGTPEAQKILDKTVADMQKAMLSGSDLNYDQDIKPWVGNMMFAMLPASADTPKEPNMVAAIAIKDKVKALAFADKMKGQSKIKSQESDFQGVKITEFQAENEKGKTYAAVVQDSYILLAPKRSGVEEGIKALKGEPSLASKGGDAMFKAAGAEVQNPVAQIYIPDYAGFIQEVAKAGNSTPLPAATMDRLKKMQSMVASVGIDDTGIRMKAIAKVDPSANLTAFKPVPGTVVSQFPTDTFAMMSSVGLKHVWTQAIEQSKGDADVEKMLTMMRDGTQQSIQMDLDKDILGWMDGEFAIGLAPVSEGLLAQAGFGGVLVMDTTDRKAAEAAIAKLDGFAKANSIGIEEKDFNGKKVTQWAVPGQGALAGHGWLDDDTVFLAIGEPLVKSVATKAGATLDGSESFKAVTSSLPKQNLGYFYVDMDKTMDLVNKAMLVSNQSAMPPEAAALLASIKGMGGTSTQSDAHTTQMEAILALKPAK